MKRFRLSEEQISRTKRLSEVVFMAAAGDKRGHLSGINFRLAAPCQWRARHLPP